MLKKIGELITKLSKVWSIVFFLGSVMVILVILMSLGCSYFFKVHGKKSYKQQNYSKALTKFETARGWWLPERLSYKLRDRDLHENLRKANVMVQSKSFFEKGLKAYDDGNYNSAKWYFNHIALNDSNHDLAQNKLEEISLLENIDESSDKSTTLASSENNILPPQETGSSPQNNTNWDTIYPQIYSALNNLEENFDWLKFNANFSTPFFCEQEQPDYSSYSSTIESFNQAKSTAQNIKNTYFLSAREIEILDFIIESSNQANEITNSMYAACSNYYTNQNIDEWNKRVNETNQKSDALENKLNVLEDKVEAMNEYVESM